MVSFKRGKEQQAELDEDGSAHYFNPERNEEIEAEDNIRRSIALSLAVFQM